MHTVLSPRYCDCDRDSHNIEKMPAALPLQIVAVQNSGHLRCVLPLDLAWKLEGSTEGAKVSLLPEGSAETWAQLVFEAEFFYFGELVEMTSEVFDQFIKNFEAQQNSVPIFPDHCIGEAAGWVRKLERRDNGLWGLLEFTDEIATAIKEGKWAYTSMGFTLQGISRLTGKNIGPELFELSLTNVPFVDGQIPLKLSRAGLYTGSAKELNMDELLAELAEKAGMDAAALEEALRDKLDAVASALKGEEPSSDSEMSRDSSGGSSAQMNRAYEIKLSALEQKNAQLEKRLNARDDKDLEAEVDGLIKSGNILPAHKAEVLQMMRKDPEGTRKVFGAQKVVPTEELPPEKGGLKSGPEAQYTALEPGDQKVVDFLRGKIGFAQAVAKVQKVVDRRAAESAEAS